MSPNFNFQELEACSKYEAMVQELKDMSKENLAGIDWAKMKEILSGSAAALSSVSEMLPFGIVKTVLAGLAAGILLVVRILPV